ncbi:MAG: transcriptional repressor LexA [Clostridiales bacterium]|uniref:LexA repressor n=1 Tax=Harryflintia acetispora TaxID=1849041 RepID=A0A9X8UIP6_9FIRM|nr:MULTISPECIES: transcriptional repressor LexA [Oscillospiraceae]PWM34661.1 MAG: transcriptional repressor LexA [Clostridiales bacterium]RGB65175.1 transcriptional repressor LexA [Harryflintia acetispora]TCL42834.1 repressor LexA [Harryflintia acetispora]
MGAIGDIHRQVLAFIVENIDNEGYPPSVREICQKLHIKSTSTVHKYLNELEQGGYIRRENAKNRSIRVLHPGGQGTQTLRVPMLGVVTAGSPILAVQETGEYISFETGRYTHDELFALQIKGESMIEAGIFDGDYIVARRTPSAENGDIVVALIEDEATVKEFYREDGHYRLQPRNSTMEPILVSEMSVLGKVVAVLRYLE